MKHDMPGTLSNFGAKYQFNILSFLQTPLVQDPYEAMTVEVRESGIEGACDGLFAKRNIREQIQHC
jgi:hypothetical protein